MNDTHVMDMPETREEQSLVPTTVNGQMALFPDSEREDFRSRWGQIQVKFVDEPRQSVEEADRLVDSVIQRLTTVFADERNKMENEWSKGQNVSTEDLRQALRRYRSFFDRLLTV